MQLRQRSRGETSRSVLDVLAHGLPLIVNSCGSMSELPDSCLIKLPEQFSDIELQQALERVRRDNLLRKQMGDFARHYIREHHNPFLIADQYRDAIECFSTTSDGARYRRLIAELANNSGPVKPSPADAAQAATCIAANRPTARTRQLLLSVSKFTFNENGAMLPNEIRELLLELLTRQQPKRRVEPVYWDGAQYRYAIGWTCRLLQVPDLAVKDTVVDVASGDVLAMLDASSEPASKQYLCRLEALGVQIQTGVEHLQLGIF